MGLLGNANQQTGNQNIGQKKIEMQCFKNNGNFKN